MVQYKDTGKDVKKIQILLSNIGYDLIADGVFGDMTLNAVKDFQRKNGLEVDGVVGEITEKKLESYKATTENKSDVLNYNFKVNTNNGLDEDQYVKEKHKKKQIYIHFTAGSDSAINSLHGWNSDDPKVATAYIIDGGNGDIYEAFHPDYYGWHLGVKGTNGMLDKSSIGIELCAFGPLLEKNGKFYAWPKNWTKEIEEKNVYKLNEEFRGYSYFYKVSDEQFESLEKILCFLIEKYNIKIQDSFDKTWFDYKPELLSKVVDGIWTHVNVRKDKTDMYPDHRLIVLLNRLAKKYNK